MYYALYRKYRPNDFDSVVGQNYIIKTLQNSIINKSFSHAYMFFGSRGTGKTSVSKIFARNVNCLSPVNGMSCKKCSACINSFSKECVDIIEIDAASNNGVDEIRDLRNNINLVPNVLKYKVYIIDEVHMLSTGAFNALLKTLEEPPEHVIFILATTDPQKVPETIISRCQCFSFKKISQKDIKNKLYEVCKNEKIDIDDSVIDKISMLSDGGLRDALGILDKIISYSDSKITLDDFNELNGTISDEDIFSFIKNVLDGNVKEILLSIDKYDNCGKNIIQIILQIINNSRDLIVDYYLNNNDNGLSINNLELFANLLNEKFNDIKKSSNTKIYIEMLLLKFINNNILKSNNVINKNFVSNNHSSDTEELHSFAKNDSTSQIKAEADNNNDDNNDDNNGDNNNDDDNNDDIININKIINIEEINNIRINNTLATADKKMLQDEVQKFQLLTEFSFDKKIGSIVNNILDSTIRACGKKYLIISYSSEAVVRQNLDNIINLEKVYNDITKSNKKIAIISDNKWDSIKNEYILNLKNNIKYELISEPELLFEEYKKDDIISNSAISLFGEDIVEIE